MTTKTAPIAVPGSAWSVEVLPDHAGPGLTEPAYVTAAPASGRLTPAGMAAVISHVTTYLTSGVVTSLNRLAPTGPHATTLRMAGIRYPCLGADVATQAAALVSVLSAPGNVTA